MYFVIFKKDNYKTITLKFFEGLFFTLTVIWNFFLNVYEIFPRMINFFLFILRHKRGLRACSFFLLIFVPSHTHIFGDVKLWKICLLIKRCNIKSKGCVLTKPKSKNSKIYWKNWDCCFVCYITRISHIVIQYNI